jgi:hypothetical protein
MKKTLELEVQKLPAIFEVVFSFRREFDLEPNADLQRVIDLYGDAAMAYQQALLGPMQSPWNPIKLYLGQSPQDEVNRLAGEYDTRRRELQGAVRAYDATLPKLAEKRRHK